jgi:nucleoside-diphosphate-sugar epimerase
MAVFLVTGGAGFIGSNLVDALAERGNIVRVFDNLSTGQLTNLTQVKEKIEFFSADLSNRQAIIEAAQGVDCIFHFAAPASATYDDLYHVTGGWTHSTDTLNVLIAAREAGVRRVIYASSGSVYAHPSALQMKESDPILPLSPYAFTELTGEHQCIAFASFYGLETVRLRYFNVFGPRQCPSSPHAAAIPIILKAMLAGQSPVLLDNVYEYQDFLYVDDAVHAALLAAEVERASGKAYNIARGRPVNLLGLIGVVNEILHTQIQPVCSVLKAEDWQAQAVSITKAEVELGFCPRADLKQAFQALIAYYAKHGEQVRTDSPEAPPKEGPHFFDKSRSPPSVTGEGGEAGA